MPSVQNPNEASVSPSLERLLDLREAAAILGMHWKTLEGMARKRKKKPVEQYYQLLELLPQP
jgi:hypothetical protein